MGVYRRDEKLQYSLVFLDHCRARLLIKMVLPLFGFQKDERPDGLSTFGDMWTHVFIWCSASSLLFYTAAAALAFFTLGKHKFGRYYSLLIFLLGFIIPLTLRALSSATISFVYKASSFRMDETHAMMWGCGQTVVHASFGITRILATL